MNTIISISLSLSFTLIHLKCRWKILKQSLGLHRSEIYQSTSLQNIFVPRGVGRWARLPPVLKAMKFHVASLQPDEISLNRRHPLKPHFAQFAIYPFPLSPFPPFPHSLSGSSRILSPPSSLLLHFQTLATYPITVTQLPRPSVRPSAEGSLLRWQSLRFVWGSYRSIDAGATV